MIEIIAWREEDGVAIYRSDSQYLLLAPPFSGGGKVINVMHLGLIINEVGLVVPCDILQYDDVDALVVVLKKGMSALFDNIKSAILDFGQEQNQLNYSQIDSAERINNEMKKLRKVDENRTQSEAQSGCEDNLSLGIGASSGHPRERRLKNGANNGARGVPVSPGHKSGRSGFYNGRNTPGHKGWL